MGSMEMTFLVGFLVEIGQQVLVTEAVSTSETSVSFYQTYMEQCPRRTAIFRFVQLFIAMVKIEVG
jgi:hypothetical protein